MNDLHIFPNAPITEAILDIKVKLPDGVGLNIFDEFQENIKDRFGDRKTKHSFQAELRFSPGKDESTPIVPKEKIEGYIFHSKNGNKIVQARLDGFTFNKLQPYEDWNKFHSEARELWELYKKITKPISVDRIALRYINRIEIPLPFDDFSEYILTNPQIAPGLPQALSHFFMRIEIPNNEIGAIAIITQTMQKQTETQILPLIFDIDVIKTVCYTGKISDMWNDFNLLRRFKNEIFFNSITEKTKELFK
ncbi:TIGR04255 family protein [bacterium]|nr:TIGR04255 family protein [bacterium]